MEPGTGLALAQLAMEACRHLAGEVLLWPGPLCSKYLLPPRMIPKDLLHPRNLTNNNPSSLRIRAVPFARVAWPPSLEFCIAALRLETVPGHKTGIRSMATPQLFAPR